MRAIVVKPELKDSIHVRDMPDPKMQPDHVAVKMLSVGLCGTDAEINEGRYGKAPDGEEFLILGHENFGVVEAVGKLVKGFKAGDLVVSTVRRPCGQCYNCLHRESDMCSSGLYEERGIIRRHGFMAEYYVESPQWLTRIPKAAAEIGVLLEPTSVVEKGIEQAFRLQERLKWRPKTALVLGSGPVGLLAAAVLRLRGLDTCIVGREPDTDSRAQIATQMGATYVCVANSTLMDVQARLPPIDLAIEATGAASSRVQRDADPRPERHAVSAQRDGRLSGGRSADRQDQPPAGARESSGVRQREREPAALQEGREGSCRNSEEMAGAAEAVDHDAPAMDGIQAMVRTAPRRHQDDDRDYSIPRARLVITYR